MPDAAVVNWPSSVASGSSIVTGGSSGEASLPVGGNVWPGTAAIGMAAGTVVIAKDSALGPASAGTSGGSLAIGVLIEDAIAHESVRVASAGALALNVEQWNSVVTGIVTDDGLTAGAPYYVSETPGRITTTPPSTPGDYQTRVGIAYDNTTLVVLIGEPVAA